MHSCSKCSRRFSYKEVLKAQSPKAEPLACPSCGAKFVPVNRILFDTLAYIASCALAFSLKFLARSDTKGLVLGLMLAVFLGGLVASVLLRPFVLRYEEKVEDRSEDGA